MRAIAPEIPSAPQCLRSNPATLRSIAMRHRTSVATRPKLAHYPVLVGAPTLAQISSFLARHQFGIRRPAHPKLIHTPGANALLVHVQWRDIPHREKQLRHLGLDAN